MCANKKVTNNSARKTTIQKLKSFEFPKCDSSKLELDACIPVMKMGCLQCHQRYLNASTPPDCCSKKFNPSPSPEQCKLDFSRVIPPTPVVYFFSWKWNEKKNISDWKFLLLAYITNSRKTLKVRFLAESLSLTQFF